MKKFGMNEFKGVIIGFCLAFLLACTLSFAAHFVPREPIKEHISKAVPLLSHFRRADTFTECLVMGSAVLPDSSIAAGVFDFPMLNFMPSDRNIPHDHETCAAMRALVSGKPVEEIGTQSYTRYWNGPVSLARFFLNVLPYLAIYIFYALFAVAAYCLWGHALARNGIHYRSAALITFAVFYGSGLAYVVGNLAHTPAFAIVMMTIAFASLKTKWWRKTEETLLLASFIGGVTLYFDMIFMAIPTNALLLGTTWLLLNYADGKSEMPARANFKNLFTLLAAYAFGGVLMLGLKVLAVGLMQDPMAVIRDFFQQLAWRMSTEDAKRAQFTLADLFFGNLPKAATKMFFHPLGTLLIYLVGTGFFVEAFRKNAKLAGTFLFLAAITPVWYLIFTNHSYIHGTFAMRILFWPPLLGVLAWCIASHKMIDAPARAR